MECTIDGIMHFMCRESIFGPAQAREYTEGAHTTIVAYLSLNSPARLAPPALAANLTQPAARGR